MAPPVPVRPGATHTVAALAAYGRDALAHALGPDMTLEGYSTHLNVSAPERGPDRLADRFARIFAPGLMLLLDRIDSPGLLVRPRPGRLELGGEYAAGAALRVALTYAAGGVLACRTMSRRDSRSLTAHVRLERAVERYGWYVDRTAFGEDLYAGGREAVLRLAGGRGAGQTRSAGEQLTLTWRLGRASLAGLLDPAELDEVDAVVAASTPLPHR